MRYAIVAAVALFSLTPRAASASAIDDGLNDRIAYEGWFGSLSGDARSGAEYWAGQRSLRAPGPCASTAALPRSAEWTSGCEAAKERLAPVDARRRAEPSTYKLGWNSWNATDAPPLSVPSPAVARPVPQAPPPAPTLNPQWYARANMECPSAQMPASGMPFDNLLFGAARARQEQDAYACQQQREQARQVIANWQADRDRAAAKAEADRQQAAQLAAEKSPDNLCAVPEMAKQLMQTFGELKLFKERGIEAIDIAHLVTRPSSDPKVALSCHGVFETNTGLQLEGTMTMRTNVAGAGIVQWSMGR